LHELSDRERGWILGGVLARRTEAYHHRLPRAVVAPPEDDDAPGDETSQSIHDLVLAKEAGLAKRLIVDTDRRGSLVDRFLGETDDLAAFVAARAGTASDFGRGIYEASVASDPDRARARLVRTGTVWSGGEPRSVWVSKELSLAAGAGEFSVVYRVVNQGPAVLAARFAVEWNLSVAGAEDTGSGYGFPDGGHAPFSEPGERSGLREIALRDGARGAAARLVWDREATVWWFPVETISLSEQGFERVTQGQALLVIWELQLSPGAGFEAGFSVAIESVS